ncbi:hypothetical protein [Micromonospora profundi]|uniref:TSCPD domain-containing protein n=1 Tax=Micromonospora profundi TaxID=1420889 RepID=UPI003668E999
MSDDNPPRRAARRYTGTTTDFVLDGTSGRLIMTTSSDQLTHIDLRVDKHGSTLAGLTEALSTAITTGLQAGAPLPEFVAPLRRTHFAPSGATTDPDVPHASSLSDYLAHRLQQHANTAPARPDSAPQTTDIRTST